MKSLIALTGAATLVQGEQLFQQYSFDVSDEAFLQYLVDFGKKYDTMDEYKQRAEAFKENVRKINQHNADPSRAFKLGVTKMSDRAASELHSHRELPKHVLRHPNQPIQKDMHGYVDWVQEGAVGPVRDQQHCRNSDHAIAMIESLEAQQYFNTGTLEPLSVQQLMDCFSNGQYRQFSCDAKTGDRPNYDDLVEYITDLRDKKHKCYKSMAEKDYKFTAKDQQQCAFDYSKVVDGAEGCHFNVKSNSDGLKDFGALLSEGPVFVNVVAEMFHMQNYQGGIIDDSQCGFTPASERTDEPDVFSVLAVGYGFDEETKTEYLKFKNSWGADWGEEGYFRVKFANPNRCGL